MARKYTTLILGLGTHEGANVATVTIGGEWSDGGFETPKEALSHFRDCLVAYVTELAQEEEETGTCSHCSHNNREPLNRYCGFCGRQLKNTERDLDLEAAQLFASWFQRQSHETCNDWEALSSGGGWNLGWITAGGYIRLDGFGGFLEEWEPEDWRDNLGEGRSWWDYVLSDARFGDLTMDAEA